MKGLLLKDWYTLLKQMRVFLLILVVFACMPGLSMAPFAIVYAAILPTTALAYDERSRWDELAVMMPYSPRELVLSKYLLGLLSVLSALALTTVAQSVLGIFQNTRFSALDFIGLLAVACVAIVLLSINLPLMFRIGVEKGRIAFLLLICGGAAGSMALRDKLLTFFSEIRHPASFLFGALLVTLAIMAVSIPVSIAAYGKKNG